MNSTAVINARHALHAAWAEGRIWIWGETAGAPEFTTADDPDAGREHPFAMPIDALRAAAGELLGELLGDDDAFESDGRLTLLLPSTGDGPEMSATLDLGLGPDESFEDEFTPEGGTPTPFGLEGVDLDLDAQVLEDLSMPEVVETEPAAAQDENDDQDQAGELAADDATIEDEAPKPVTLGEFTVPAISLSPSRTGDALARLAEVGEDPSGRGLSQIGESVVFYAVCDRFARYLIAQHRVAPMVAQDGAGQLTGLWLPWLSDEDASARLEGLLEAMPPVARAAVDATGHDTWAVVEQALDLLVDARCRETLVIEDMLDTVRERDPLTDEHVAWLQGMLGHGADVPASPGSRADMARAVREWIGTLEDRGQDEQWRLLFRMNEPLGDPEAEGVTEPDQPWSLSFHLQSVDDDQLVVDAVDIWMFTRETVVLDGRRLERPQELLLSELGRASRLFPNLESALGETEPIEASLKTREAYEFLREIRPLLEEQGFSVETPMWWDTPAAKLGARLKIEASGDDPFLDSGGSGTGATTPQLGLETLVKYQWEIAVGDTSISLHQFEQLAESKSPLVQIGGRWVEVRPEDLKAAIRFIRENPGGEMKIGEAIRLAYAADPKETGFRIAGLEADGWLASFFEGFADAQGDRLPIVDPPESFDGTLRPYQLRGVSWLAFMERFGFGACLADDMGLGKTIQLLALLLRERELHAAELDRKREGGTPEDELPALRPTLLVVPTSVVGNWVYEAKRFGASMRSIVHHGVERAQGDAFVQDALDADIIVTTYTLAHRDRELLRQVPWRRVVLDEAQYIKNPQAKQSQAVRSIESESRIVLTGTPVENRLSELWSIMDFLNPGYLGSVGTFRKRFGLPIERYRDPHRLRQLRGLVQPFILRRLKTDPNVVTDLPAKVETREFAHLTPEQARLYEQCVKQMLGEVEQTEGIRRRGLVLSALVRLKQICNHPSQLLKDLDPRVGTPVPARSGKCVRLMEILENVLAEGEQALVFTQFRQMGLLLTAMLEHEFNRPVLFIHGGTPRTHRERMVEEFQRRDGTRPIMLLSLKAGGVGLNLTAATHVVHFDRWWNPAVENQATDRAHRIGQTRTVQVHKFVVRGTLEERIDEMIEQKLELAENIIGAGENWLTEMDTDELRNILQLRAEAIGDE